MTLQQGDRVRLPGETDYVEVDLVSDRADGGADLYVLRNGRAERLSLTANERASLEVLSVDGNADPAKVLAALWSQWMHNASITTTGTALGSAPLRPYLHQHEAVYGAMLPQAMLRFLLADEPGTGKTIMAGLYVTEAARLGFVNRGLVICPAHLVGKWQNDMERFFGRTLRRITADTVREQVLELSNHPLWIVSLHLAASNPQVREAIDPDRAGWDLVIVDEAHAMTPSAQTYFQVGLTVVAKAPRALLMTATPHRGSEWLFRCLMHLTDPAVYPLPDQPDNDEILDRLRPGSMHFLRRMKEELVDVDGRTPLFKKRTAHNEAVSLNLQEKIIYDEALRIVEEYFPPSAVGLGRMVYGKRAASSLYALGETLRRRSENMGQLLRPSETAVLEEDEDERELIEISHLESRSSRQEKQEIGELMERVEAHLSQTDPPLSKWPRLESVVLGPNGILPGEEEQLVVFTEYADTAEWLTDRFQSAGFSAEMYSGRQSHEEREVVRGRFIAGEFQVIVSTDAGNEGIDLQSARVLANWDIPWSLVKLEQRMGRIHRVGQTRDVDLYNLIATDTREGDAHLTLLNNLVSAANELGGKMFDSLDLVGTEALRDAGINDLEKYLAGFFQSSADSPDKTSAVRAITNERVRQIHQQQRARQSHLAGTVQIGTALAGLNDQRLERINPHIVERYLTRLSDAGLINLSRSSVADEGLWRIGTDGLGSRPLGAGRKLIATSGEARMAAVKAGAIAAEHAIALGPNEAPFRDLVAAARRRVLAELYRGGSLADPTSVTDYRLFCFEVGVEEGRLKAADRWRHASTWSYLVKVDDAGQRIAPWETLANLDPSPHPAGRSLHPAEETNAMAQAAHQADRHAAQRRDTLAAWLKEASTQLQKLPNDLTDDIEPASDRQAARREVEAATEARIGQLEAAVELSVGKIEPLGWAHVSGTATPGDIVEDTDSEVVAMKHVTALLGDDDWGVADVHTERVGYDLKATRGSQVRLVEVKGIRGSASSEGIGLTGAELATAGIHGTDYWLYVVDHCADGSGVLFDAWPNPAEVFAGALKDVALLRIPGSALSAAKKESEA